MGGRLGGLLGQRPLLWGDVLEDCWGRGLSDGGSHRNVFRTDTLQVESPLSDSSNPGVSLPPSPLPEGCCQDAGGGGGRRGEEGGTPVLRLGGERVPLINSLI